MIYSFLQRLVKIVLWVFFRKIYFSGRQHIPLNQPLILACNHPNSFMDAVLLAVLIKKPIHFLARSDVFNAPWKKWLLTKMHLIPIYRLEEGIQNLHKNQDTFAQCYHILKNNGIVLIFSEGICVLEKRLRPLRKGTARLAFGAEEANGFNLNLQVVPIGLNYTYPTQFRKEVMIGAGEPIPVKEFSSLYSQNPAKAIKVFNNRLESELRKNIVIVEKPEQEALAEELFIKNRLQSDDFYNNKWLSEDRIMLEQERQIGLRLSNGLHNRADIPFPIQFETIQTLSKSPSKFLLISGFPIFLLGYILNILPLGAARYFAQKKVKYIEFYASVMMVLGMVFYLIYWPIVSLILACIGGISFLFWFVMIPITGYGALKWYDYYQLYTCLKKYRS